MGDVLSQSEVEALLQALDTDQEEAGGGGGSAATGGKAPELNDIFNITKDVTLYDFKRPERVGKEHMKSLQTLHEGFSRSVGASFSGLLRTIVDIKLVSVDQLTYSEFIFSLENPTCFNVLAAPPLEGNMILEMNPSIIYPILDRLLGGGRGEALIPRRSLTEIESRLVRRICKLCCDGLQVVWSNVIPTIEYRVQQIESNPQLVYIVPPNEVIVLISFEIALGDLRGMMNLCVPFTVIEPVIDKLSANSWFSFKKHEKHTRKRVEYNLKNAPIEIVCNLGETKITARQLLDLQVGDILPIEKSCQSDLLLTVMGKPKYWGKPFTKNNKKVISITKNAIKNDRINE